MTLLDANMVAVACADDSDGAGITIRTTLEPLAGPGTPVKPATYEGGRYQLDRRWWDVGDDRVKVDVVVVDNPPSQANRHEAALERLCQDLGLPEVILDLEGVGELPPHLPRRLSGFRFPHRNADAYLRDAMLDGERFPDTDPGKAIFSATAEDPAALLEWFPQALLYGFWQSHLGKKRSQAKLARSWTSEIVGYDPATTDTRSLGLKGDPLNLSVAEALEFDPDDQLANEWKLGTEAKAKGRTKATDALSNVGHGQVLVGEPDASPSGVSFAEIVQHTTVSFAGLRRLNFGRSEANSAGRALLAAMGIVAHVAAFGRSFSLRSGCELRPSESVWMWLDSREDQELTPFTAASARKLFAACVGRAESAGLPVGSQWRPEPLFLEPNHSLAEAIRASWPLEG